MSSGRSEWFDVTSIEVVRRFCEQWPGLSPAAIADFFAPDGAYLNESISRPLIGGSQIAGAIEIYRARFDQIESSLARIAETDEAVLCERTDRFWLPSGRLVEVQAMASIELSDGKIVLWRDYFDVAQLKRQVDLTEA